MNDVGGYIILNKNTSYVIKLFMLISFVILIFLIIISQLKYKKYYQTIGQVIEYENDFYLSLYLTPYQLDIIKDNNILFIDDYEYDYDIKFIDDEYLISNDYTNYVKVVLDIKIKEKDKILNNLLEIKVLESDKKLFYYVKDYFEKGLENEKNK